MEYQTLELIVRGRKVMFRSCDALSYSDYDNSCAVERANVKTLKEQAAKSPRGVIRCGHHIIDRVSTDPLIYRVETDEKRIPALVVFFGGYGHEQTFLPCTKENMELLDALEDYPVIDDGSVSFMETEMIDEAWIDYGRDDFIRELSREYLMDDYDGLDALREMDENVLKARYLHACDRKGDFPRVEAGGSVYFPSPISSAEDFAAYFPELAKKGKTT